MKNNFNPPRWVGKVFITCIYAMCVAKVAMFFTNPAILWWWVILIWLAS